MNKISTIGLWILKNYRDKDKVVNTQLFCNVNVGQLNIKWFLLEHEIEGYSIKIFNIIFFIAIYVKLKVYQLCSTHNNKKDKEQTIQ